MTYNGELVRAGRSRVARRAKRTVVGGLAAALLFATPAVPTSASTVASTRSQITALEGEVQVGADRIHTLTEAYDAAASQAAALAQQLQAQLAALASARAQLAERQSILTRVALQSYTGDDPGALLPTTADADPAVNAEYLSLATDDLTDSIDQFQLQQRQVSAQVNALRQQEAASRRVLAQAESARQQALAAATEEQQRLGSLQVALASEVSASTQGQPVNNGLVDVVTTQTGGSAPPANPPTSPPTTEPTTSPPTTEPPAPSPPPSTGAGGGGAGGVWLELRECESGDDYQADTGNGYYGAYQFSEATWVNLGYPGRPDLEPPAMQDAAAMRLQAEAGWGQWPACAAALGLT